MLAGEPMSDTQQGGYRYQLEIDGRHRGYHSNYLLRPRIGLSLSRGQAAERLDASTASGFSAAGLSISFIEAHIF